MNTPFYGYKKIVSYPFEKALEKTIEELKKEGFGILTTIDLQAKMKEKLNKDMERYVILGACNPPLAFEAIEAEKEIGLLLPCNVIVYETSGKVHVSAVIPSVAMGFIQNQKLASVAAQVEPKLKAVIDRLL